MKRHLSKMWLLGLTLLGALGCGGGGGSASATAPSPQPTNQVTLVLPPPSRIGGGSYWVACQDGAGAWWVLTGVPSGPSTTTYSFLVNDPAGRYGLAVVNLFPVGTSTGVLGLLQHFTLAEARTLDYSAWGPTSVASVMGTVSGLAPTDGARIATGNETETLGPGASATMLSALTGTADFLAARLPAMGPADALVVRRAYPVSSTAPTTVGFHFPDGWPLVPQSCSVTGLAPTESLSLTAEWRTASTPIKLAEGSGTPMAFNAVPPDRMQSTDLHVLAASANDALALTLRSAWAYSLSAANLVLDLPGIPSAPVWGAGSGSTYFRPSLSWTPLEGAMVQDVTIGDVYTYLDWEIHLSKGWLGSSGTASYTFPDFASTSGWSPTWGLPFGRDLYWNVGQRATTHVDAGFYFAGPRSFLAGHSAWETLIYGGMNIPAPGATPQWVSQPRVDRRDLALKPGAWLRP